MSKRETIWVVATLAATAIIWLIYSSFIEEAYVDPGAAAQVEVIDNSIDTTGVENHGMDVSQFTSVGDDEE